MSFSLRGAQAFVGSTGRESIPSSGVSGLRRSARAIELSGGRKLFWFSSGEGAGPSRVLGAPLHELFEAHPSLRDLMGSKAKWPSKKSLRRMARAPSGSPGLAVLARIAQGLQRRSPHRRIGSPDQQARWQPSRPRLIEDLPISLDAYEKRFKRQVETTPKHFSSLVQMRSAIDHYALEPSLIEAALSAGYFDQPHFTPRVQALHRAHSSRVLPRRAT